MDVQAVLDRKRAEVAELQEDIRVLERLMAETSRATQRTSRRGRSAGQVRQASARAAAAKPRGSRSGKRAKRGENQRRILAILDRGPQGASDIARAIGVAPANANAVLKVLVTKGLLKQDKVRGPYSLVTGSAAAPEPAAPKGRKGLKPGNTSNAKQRPTRKASAQPKEAVQPSTTSVSAEKKVGSEMEAAQAGG